ncbi:hypothetical protein [Acetobacter vaccinii]|uniref:Uncharacterized protein n=1 Tax=Acetobacter vaccinii TaxID=2592655 RepID=A0A5C1YRW5_9PROT|nr:hypothetical protein [Acetobacter vaccinii]QEO18791.1 hypothetical protein FLP30_12980 [Acetobacter vaccinii]
MIEYYYKFLLCLSALTMCCFLMLMIVFVLGHNNHGLKEKQEALNEKQQAWQSFSVAHHCKVIAYKEGYSSVGATSGVGLTTSGHLAAMSGSTDTKTPSQTAYSCDNGVTYWRNNE